MSKEDEKSIGTASVNIEINGVDEAIEDLEALEEKVREVLEVMSELRVSIGG